MAPRLILPVLHWILVNSPAFLNHQVVPGVVSERHAHSLASPEQGRENLGLSDVADRLAVRQTLDRAAHQDQGCA